MSEQALFRETIGRVEVVDSAEQAFPELDEPARSIRVAASQLGGLAVELRHIGMDVNEQLRAIRECLTVVAEAQAKIAGRLDAKQKRARPTAPKKRARKR